MKFVDNADTDFVIFIIRKYAGIKCVRIVPVDVFIHKHCARLRVINYPDALFHSTMNV